MFKETPVRRCCHCTRRFVADPRVGGRQVTCGAWQCQRARHCERCRAWHAANSDVAGTHYEDVVVPFRERQPDYQRRWRLAARLREIREESSPISRVLLTSLRALMGRAQRLAESPTRDGQTGVLAAKMLDKAMAALRFAIAALEQLEASVATLQALRL